MRDNFKELYLECKKIIKPSEKDLIIDIGSNDGNLLSNFKKNHKVLGITPEKLVKLQLKKGIKTLLKYFDSLTCKIILKKIRQSKNYYSY